MFTVFHLGLKTNVTEPERYLLKPLTRHQCWQILLIQKEPGNDISDVIRKTHHALYFEFGHFAPR